MVRRNFKMDSAPHLAEQSSGCDMITESLTIQVLHIISLALTPIEQWEAAKRYFYTASSAEVWLTVFAVVALIILVILLFWLSAKRRNSEHRLKSNKVVTMLRWDDTDDSESGNGADNHNATGSGDGNRSNKSSKEGASPAEMLVLIAQAEEKLSKAGEKGKD